MTWNGEYFTNKALNEHCAGCEMMNQKRQDDINGSNVTKKRLVLKNMFLFLSLLGIILNYIVYLGVAHGNCRWGSVGFTTNMRLACAWNL